MKIKNTPTIPNRNEFKLLLIASIAGLMFGTAAVQADDVEIYLTPPPSPVPPNVLFILDESGSMSSTTHTVTGAHSTRITDLRDALTNILNDPDNDNINAGIMAYTTHLGSNGPLSLRAVSDFGLIETNRTPMVTAVGTLTARSYTPSVKALEAGVEWFRNAFTDTQYNWTVAHRGTTPQTYQSPIGNTAAGNWCRPNHMVFLTDGRPNSNTAATTADPGHNSNHVGAFIPHYGVTDYPIPGTTTPAVACANDPFFGAGLCSSEIVRWASGTDLKTGGQWDYDTSGGGNLRIQNIVTNTIGFGIGAGSTQEGYLMNIANEGTGNYYPAANATDLKNAFASILSDAQTSIPLTYNAPTIPYNPDNAALSGDFLYVPSFSPMAKRYWKGNLKKYRIIIDTNSNVLIRDRNGADALMYDTNGNLVFDPATQDYWSSTPNTGAVYYGGAVSNMSSTTTRRLYTWLAGSNPDLTATVVTVDPSGNPVTISPNRVHNNNILITEALVGAGSPAFRTTLLDWANWIGDKPPSTPSTTANPTYSSNDDFPIVSTSAGTNPDGLREYMGAVLHEPAQLARYRPALNFTPDDGVGGGAVDAALDTITFGQAPIWNTGDIVVYSSEGGTRLPIQGGGALSDGGEYYVVSVSGTAIQLALSAADATAGIVIDLADATGITNAQSLTTRVAIDIVLIATSEGVLHAFNGGSDTATTAVGDGGGELWSFMPRQFLDKIDRLRDNPAATTPDYGLDGPMTIFDSGGKKYVAVTMRRGGRNMYVLDITDITKPQMAWEIIGGSTAGFTRLGQTWSEPQFLKMELDGAAARDVLVFGGGYDNTTQDHDPTTGVIPASRVDDTMGNAIYVVDAATGARLAYFSADTTTNATAGVNNRLEVPGMENGIIGILPVDINNNGIIDRLYATGVGGRVIRIDIPDSGFVDTTISGGVIADVNSGGSGFQRFFNKPEVAYYSRGGVTFLGILIGSGYRPSPLDNTTTDRFYMIKDTNVFTVPGSYTAIGEGNLYDATLNLIQDGTPAQQVTAQAALDASSGWFIDLLDGSINQKNFSSAFVFNSVILFTVYQGQRNPSADVCEASTTSGLSSVYAIDLLNASAKQDLNGDGVIDVLDRKAPLGIPGLPPTPVIIFPPGGGGNITDGKGKVIVGLEGVFDFPDRFFPVNWEEIIKITP